VFNYGTPSLEKTPPHFEEEGAILWAQWHLSSPVMAGLQSPFAASVFSVPPVPSSPTAANRRSISFLSVMMNKKNHACFVFATTHHQTVTGAMIRKNLRYNVHVKLLAIAPNPFKWPTLVLDKMKNVDAEAEL